jgi:DNA-binding CsgD family transcriptional regulator
MLSTQQLQCLVLVAEGLTYDQIATAMHISPEVARNHMGAARDAFGASNCAGAVATALRHGVIRYLGHDGIVWYSDTVADQPRR